MHPLRASIATARDLRKSLTPPEARLWTALRRRGLDGLKFRRQHPIGPFILDFFCGAAKLAVEVDGGVHTLGDNPARDERRDLWLERHGLTVLRIGAEQVRGDLDGVLEIIRQAAARSLAEQDGGGGPLRRLRRHFPRSGEESGVGNGDIG